LGAVDYMEVGEVRMKPLNISTICERIAVQAPYFAFSKLEGQNQTVRGAFIPEQDTGFERGAVAAAEIGRHLAILGSCAAVASRPAEKTYYLATKGRLNLLRNPKRGTDQTYQAVAEVVTQDKRSLIIQAIATDGEPFAHLRCEYQVLSETLFARTFKHYHTGPVPAPDGSPYTKAIALNHDDPDGMVLMAHSRPLSPSRFAGHFPDYPAWPVAIIADTVSQVISRLLHHILNKEVTYTVVRTDVNALRLVSASESLAFRVECIEAFPSLSRYVFFAQVLWGEILAATLEVEVFV